MIEACPGFGDGGGVGEHADGALGLGEVSVGHTHGRLVVDSHFESRRTPVHELNPTSS